MTIALDLARELREAASRGYFYNHSSLVMEAAAEIIKLRAAIRRIDGLNDNPACYNADIDAVIRALEQSTAKD
jgi:hypothetical protein